MLRETKKADKKAAKVTVDCPKCNGQKYFEAYGHVKNGVCFRCNGVGTVETTVVSQKAKAARAAKRTADAAEWTAAREAKLEEILEANPAVAEAVAAAREDDHPTKAEAYIADALCAVLDGKASVEWGFRFVLKEWPR